MQVDYDLESGKKIGVDAINQCMPVHGALDSAKRAAAEMIHQRIPVDKEWQQAQKRDQESNFVEG
jgi:hypothetical protein